MYFHGEFSDNPEFKNGSKDLIKKNFGEKYTGKITTKIPYVIECINNMEDFSVQEEFSCRESFLYRIRKICQCFQLENQGDGEFVFVKITLTKSVNEKLLNFIYRSNEASENIYNLKINTEKGKTELNFSVRSRSFGYLHIISLLLYFCDECFDKLVVKENNNPDDYNELVEKLIRRTIRMDARNYEIDKYKAFGLALYIFRIMLIGESIWDEINNGPASTIYNTILKYQESISWYTFGEFLEKYNKYLKEDVSQINGIECNTFEFLEEYDPYIFAIIKYVQKKYATSKNEIDDEDRDEEEYSDDD